MSKKTPKQKTKPGDVLITEQVLFVMFRAANLTTSLRTVQRRLDEYPELCPVIKTPPGSTEPEYHYKRVWLGDAEKLIALLKKKRDASKRRFKTLLPVHGGDL